LTADERSEFAFFAKSATKAGTMYEAHFQLKKRPFSTTPDPSCVFAPGPIQELIDELILRAESGQGIAILTAPAGTGKTLLCRRLTLELVPRLTPIFLPNANFPTRRALLQSILFELGKRYSGLDEQELRLAVFASLRELTLAGRGAVLIIDEAHLLNDRLLEEVRLLASLAEAEQPLARVILAGQPPLEEKLAAPALEALNQRVACQVYVEPLTRQQSIDYIEFRIKWAGGDCPRIFSSRVLERIATACNGLPRCLNQLCDHTLLLAYAKEQSRVDEGSVDEALEDLKQLPLRWSTPVALRSAAELVHESPEFEKFGHLNEDAPAAIVGSPAAPAAETVCFEIGDADLAIDSATISSGSISSGSASSGSASSGSASSGSTLSGLTLSGLTLSGLTGRSSAGATPAPGFVKASPAVHLPATPARSERNTRDTIVPRNATKRPAQIFAEEVLDDRYASLDKSPRRFLRTFEDAFVPETWLPFRQASDSSAPLPPSPLTPSPPAATAIPFVASEATIDDPRPDELIDEMLPLIAESGGFGSGPRESSSEFLSTRDLNFEPRFSDDTVYQPSSVGAGIESDILDECLAVQATIGSWAGGTDGVNSIETNRGWFSTDERTNLPASDIDYDVIEPTTPTVSMEEVEMTSGAIPTGSTSGARHVAGPKYRHVFSTLRRRLGQGRRDRR
jgi:type II secretory pathway predicted ATPase ExeA